MSPRIFPFLINTGKAAVCGMILSIPVLTGCQSHEQSSAPKSAVATPPGAAPQDEQAAGVYDDDATMLARRTSQYARDVAPLLNQPAVPATQPTPQNSIVQWTTPAQDNNPPQSQSPAPPAQASAPPTPPADNSSIPHASLAAATIKDDVPEILPESADHIPPADAAAPANTAVTLSSDDYEKKLHQDVMDYPRDLGNQLDYQLLRFVRDEPAPDLSTVSGLTPEDREIVSALIDGISNFRNTVRADSNLMLSRKIQPLLDMDDRLRAKAELTIPTIALCTRVDSFGVYRPVTSMRFAAGHENEVIVYCEVSNFNSVQNDDKMWETKLNQEMTLYTESGMAVWPQDSDKQLFVDTARTRRHDFFVPRRLKLPSELTIGRYLLKVTITEPDTNRMAEATTPLEIVAGD
jgi:hypothetical protein